MAMVYIDQDPSEMLADPLTSSHADTYADILLIEVSTSLFDAV